MGVKRETVIFCICERCGHKWQPVFPIKEIKVCPRCKSPYWNVPRQKKK